VQEQRPHAEDTENCDCNDSNDKDDLLQTITLLRAGFGRVNLILSIRMHRTHRTLPETAGPTFFRLFQKIGFTAEGNRATVV
jgi:hypothetical protein